jgi:hypothetical protein
MRTISYQHVIWVLGIALACLLGNVWLGVKPTRGTDGANALYAGNANTQRMSPAAAEDLSGVSQGAVDPNKAMGRAMIVLTKFEITDGEIQLEYQVKNESDHEIWICESAYETGEQYKVFEAFMDHQSHTLIIRKRLDVPMLSCIEWFLPPHGRYVRLRPGESRSECISHVLPFYAHTVYHVIGQEQGIEYAKRLLIEIGFYDEDLPAKIRAILTEADRFTGTFSRNWYPFDEMVNEYFAGLAVRTHMGGVEWFNQLNEGSIEKGKLVIPYTYQALKGERILRISIDGLLIAYGHQKDGLAGQP